MAKISKRFENPKGRHVPRIPATIFHHGASLSAADHNGMHMTEFVFALRTEDGRTVWVSLTKTELAEINVAAANWAAKFSWADDTAHTNSNFR